MRFRVLGPVEIDRDGSLVTLARRQERSLLGILLLEQGRLVPVDRLCELLWDGEPPEHARRSLQSHAARIRAVLSGAELVSRSGGYLLRVDPAQVDAHQFRALVREASAAAEPERRAELLRAALQLWRGPVLQDAASDRLREQLCADLDELHLHAIEESMDAGLDLGQPLVAELAALTAAHPTRERLVELQMRALHQAGRPADALDVFARARERLADQLGADPGPGLTRLHQAILRGDVPSVATAAPPPRHVSRCLPRDIGDFTGREEVLASLLAAIPSQPDLPSAILAIDGMPGVGKTALAVRLAHRVAQRYPDGQLAIDLYGHSEQAPMEPAAALDRLLRQLGVPGDRIPGGLDARVELWRTELAGRRMLLLLDNAAASDQVAALLPTGSGCLTLVTSRRRLAGLDGARSLALEVLSPDEAIALMHRVVGPRILAEPDSAAEVARRCQYLALAVRLAAARLSHRPSWTVRDLLSRLDPGLDEIAIDGRSVVGAFRLSYDTVSAPAQRMFRLLGLHPGPDIDARAAAALADLDLDAADAVLNELVDAHLLDEPSAGRYAFHDLLKEYAARVAMDEPTSERQAAMLHLLDYYLHSATSASRAMEHGGAVFAYELGPRPRLALDYSSPEDARTWLAVERVNLLAMVDQSFRSGWREQGWRLARATWRFLHEVGFPDEAVGVMNTVLDAARKMGDPSMAGLAHNYLAGTYYQRGQWEDALAHIDEALSRRRAAGDKVAWAISIENRCKILYRRGRYAEARAEAAEALRAINGVVPTPPVTFQLEIQIGVCSMALGDYPAAEASFNYCVAYAAEHGSRFSRGLADAHVGALALHRLRFSEAGEVLEGARQVLTIGSAAVVCECDLGSAYRGLGDLPKALLHQRHALAAAPQCGVVFECDVRIELAITLHHAGQDDEAITHLTTVLDTLDRIDVTPQRAKALDTLGTINKDAALRTEAEALYRELGIPRPVIPSAWEQ